MSQPKIFAFVLMPFESDFDDIYNFGIKEPASAIDIRAERVDEQMYQEGILDRIYRQIDVADIIIADMTGKNPNVFYEVGYAHAKGKLTILLTSNADDIPFDLKHRRHIIYNSIKILSQNLCKELLWAKTEVNNVRSTHIKAIPQKISGYLELTKYEAYGELYFKINLKNDSKKKSLDIEALYFYSGKGWSIEQDGKECPSNSSDIEGFARSHFLNPPLHKLQSGSWAQVNFTSKKSLATAYKGEELKSSYRLSGRSVLRLVTSDGNYDYEIPIDVTVAELPF